MGSKTRIIVLHMKEIIYTAIFIALGILLAVLLAVMFWPDKSRQDAGDDPKYHPGIYTSSMELNNTTLEVEVTVDESHINSIRFSNLDETVTAMFPLIQPAIEEIAEQIYESQSLEDISYPEDTPYTSRMIVDSIRQALEKAAVD